MCAHTVRAHLHHIAWTHVRVLLVVEFLTIYVSVTCVNNVMLSSHYINFFDQSDSQANGVGARAFYFSLAIERFH